MTFFLRGALATGVLLAFGACGSDEPGTGGITGLTNVLNGAADSGLTAGDGGLDGSSLTGLDGSLTGLDGSLTGLDGSLTGLDGSLTGLDGSLTGLDAGATGDGGSTGSDGGSIDYDGAVPDATTDATPIGPDGASTPTVDPSLAGPYMTDSTTEGLRDGPQYASQTLWYPKTGDGPFPIVAVVPGWVSYEVQIADWGPFLASNGFIVLTIGTNSPATDMPPDRAAALLDALVTLKAENTRSGSPVEGRVDASRSGVIGWSMGGGGSLLAGEQDSSIDAVISLAAWNPNYQYTKISQPALLMAAASDLLAGGQSQGFYSSIPNSVPKMIWESTHVTAFFGGHDTFNSPNALDGEVGEYGLAWLKAYVAGETGYLTFLKTGAPMSDHTAFCTNIDGADAKKGGPDAVGCP